MPKIYPGNKVSKVTLDNSVETWSFGSSQYVKDSIENIERNLKTKGQLLKKETDAPILANYRPEIDISVKLDDSEASYYQSLIGILRWIVELGRLDIGCEVSMLVSCMVLPSVGLIEQVLHIFSYLKSHHNTEMVFDPSEPNFDVDRIFPREDWSGTLSGELQEELTHVMPEVRAFGLKIVIYVDIDHSGDNLTRHSRIGFIVLLNNSPIYWTSKKQTSIETSTFSSEFIALGTACEYSMGLRYKL